MLSTDIQTGETSSFLPWLLNMGNGEAHYVAFAASIRLIRFAVDIGCLRTYTNLYTDDAKAANYANTIFSRICARPRARHGIQGVRPRGQAGIGLSLPRRALF